MFSIGEKIVYGSTGVCTIIGVGVPDVPGATRECYILKPEYVANSKVYAPIEGNPVNMRALLKPDQAQNLIDIFPDIQCFPPSVEKQEMYNVYRTAIKSADSFVLAKLLKTLHEKKALVKEQKKTMPSTEKEYYDTAEKMLFGELSTVLDIPFENMQNYIANRIEPVS